MKIVVKREKLRTAPAPSGPITLVTAGLSGEDFAYVKRFFSAPNWKVEGFAALEDAARHLAASPDIGVVLCAHDLPGGTWQDLWGRIQSRSRPPILIVVARHADEEMWAEVLNEGAYDLLPAPFEGDELFQVVGLAWHSWLRRDPAPADRGTVASGAA